MTQKYGNMDNISLDLIFLISYVQKIECRILLPDADFEDLKNTIPVVHVVGMAVFVKNLGFSTGDEKLDEILLENRNLLVHSKNSSTFTKAYNTVIDYVSREYGLNNIEYYELHQILDYELIYKNNLHQYNKYERNIRIYTGV